MKLTLADGASGDYFGYSLAISPDGNSILVGAPNDDDKGANSGSVYMFDGTGTQLMKLTAADGAAQNRFGSLVVMSSDGNRVAVGTGSDSVYIFDGAGTQLTKLTVAGVSGDEFGYSMAISSDGSRIAIGAPKDDDKGSDSGAVYIFDGSGTQLTKLIAADTALGDNFGKSVAMSADGNRLAVGADIDDDKGYDSGSVYLFGPPPTTSTNTETMTSHTITATSTTETSLTSTLSSSATETTTSQTTTEISTTETSLTTTVSSSATETMSSHTATGTEISATDVIVESSGCDRGAACTSLAAIAAAVVASLVL